MGNIVEYQPIKSILIAEQTLLNLTIQETQNEQQGAPVIITGKGVLVRRSESGVLCVQTDLLEDEDASSWTELPFVAPNQSQHKRVGECTLQIAADHTRLEAIHFTGEDIRLQLTGLEVGILAVNRSVSRQRAESGGRAALRNVIVRDCAFDEFRAHLTGGTLDMADVGFTETAMIVGHGAGSWIRNVGGAGYIFQEIPHGNCVDACRAAMLTS